MTPVGPGDARPAGHDGGAAGLARHRLDQVRAGGLGGAEPAGHAAVADAQVEAVAGALNREVPSVVSVFAGRVADTGVDPLPLMKESLQLTSALPSAELLWASVREVFNIAQAAACGCHIVTVTHDIQNVIFMSITLVPAASCVLCAMRAEG